MRHMAPLRAPRMAQIALALCDLIRVVREGIVDSAAVQVKIFAVVFHRNAGTFDVPARIADAPRRVPFQGLILEL